MSKKSFCQVGGRGSKLSTIRNGHPAAPGGLQRSLAHWAYFALLRPLGARFVRPPPLPPSIRNGRSAALTSSLAALLCSLGLLRPVSATGGGLRASHQFPLKSYGFPGAETAKKRFLLWKMGFSAAAYCEPMHPCYYIRAPRPRQPVAARDNSLPKLYNGKAMA